MSTIDLLTLKNLISALKTNETAEEINGELTEYGKHTLYMPFTQPMLSNVPQENQILQNYLLGNKEVNKIKRLDPTKKVVDAFDIDWTGYEINFKGNVFKPTTTFELLDLIFRILTFLYDIHGSPEVVWNDAGAARAEEHKLEWGRGEFRDDPNDSDAILDSRSSNNYWGKPIETNNTPN